MSQEQKTNIFIFDKKSTSMKMDVKEMDFEKWLQVLQKELSAFGYDQSVDKTIMINYYQKGEHPGEVAEKVAMDFLVKKFKEK